MNVTEDDAIVHLRSINDSSLGAIVAAQVIEHFPYAELLEFVWLAREKLRPGGRLIAETVNPHAPRALKTFWVDLTHHHPVFPEVALALCRAAGFPRAYVFCPGGRGDVERDRFEIGDYAVVAELGLPE
jgi:cyclopropane fatty-acyl-phospholipid synthase-like methyltransferase